VGMRTPHIHLYPLIYETNTTTCGCRHRRNRNEEQHE
jgi:hypothetical protein